MSKLKPLIELHQDHFRPLRDGKAQLVFHCCLTGDASDKEAYKLRVLHRSEDGDYDLGYHNIRVGEKVSFDKIVDFSLHTKGRVIALLEELDQGTEVNYLPSVVPSQLDNLISPLGLDTKPQEERCEPVNWGFPTDPLEVVERNEKDKSDVFEGLGLGNSRANYKLFQDRDVRKRRNQGSQRRQPSAIEVVQRESLSVFVHPNVENKQISDSLLKKQPVKERRGEKIQRQKTSKQRVSVLPPVFNRAVKILKVPALLAVTILGSLAVYETKKAYDLGLEDAKTVAHDARLLSELPILRENDKGSYEVVAYVSPKPFIEDVLDRIDNESTITHEKGKTQRDSIQSVRRIPVTAVQPGGPLYLTRQALTLIEDNLVEENLGINPLGVLGAIKSQLTGGSRGGSSIHDQLCGQIWEQTATVAPESSQVFLAKLKRKKREAFCGIGLGFGGQMDTDELFAHYMTYVYVGGNMTGYRGFIERYWGIKDLDDPKFTTGMKLILAALPKYVAPRRSGGLAAIDANQDALDLYWAKTTNSVKPRTAHALERLIEEGVIDEKEKSKIIKEIRAAKLILQTYHNNWLAEQESGFFEVMATKELKEYFHEQMIDPEKWFMENDGIITSLDPQLQEEVARVMQEGLQDKQDNVRGTAFVVNGDGEYVSIFTGSKDGFDGQATRRRLYEWEQPGSTGKLTIGSELASMGYTPETAKAAAYSIKYSKRRLANDANSLHVRPEPLKRRLECFGRWRDNVKADTALEMAVTGNWEIQAAHMPAYFYSIMTGEVLPHPHLISGALSKGQIQSWTFSQTRREQDCAQLMYQGGRTIPWAELPLQGTMSAFENPKKLELIGKTGTAKANIPGKGNRSTNIVWAPFAVRMPSQEVYTAVVFMRPENIDSIGRGTGKNFTLDMAWGQNSGTLVVPTSHEVFKSITSLRQ